MSLSQISKHVISRSTCLRSSYVEISRFLCPSHHRITSSRKASRSKNVIRQFSESRTRRKTGSVDENLQTALEDFKASIRPSTTVPLNGHWSNHNPPALDSEVELYGYLSTRRDVNRKLAFTVLRNQDQSHCIQLISSSNIEGQASKAHDRLRSLREWTPVVVQGKVVTRKPCANPTLLGMTLINDREISVTDVRPLNTLSNDLIIKEDTVFGPEQRHLQLRIDREARENLKFRANTTQRARSTLMNEDFTEIETPILFKSTPEGAREFLVPSRQKGLAYALPQSPQQYKQILMASGITRYFQFARCFRDEDLRADRQPEFTQLDIEMAFAGEEEVMRIIEVLIRKLWKGALDQELPEQFSRMSYQEAMSSYGSDKPDLRFEAKIHNITQHLPADLIKKITPLESATIDAFKISLGSSPKALRKFVSTFLDSPVGKPFLDNPHGQPGIFVSDQSQPMGGLGPLGYQYVMEGPEELSLENGDLLVLQARPDEPLSGGSTTLGNLRLAIHKAAISEGLIDAPEKDEWKFIWITDFPLFTPSNGTDPGQGGSAGFASTHHPFTAPKTPADIDMLLSDPSRATAAHYDIVLNGVELGGGSRRIQNAEIQEFIFRDVLKMKPERIEDFRHLMDVLRSGCPPHAGIALGWDRLTALMRGKESVRDVIAFPKTGKGEDPLVKSPNEMTAEQLETYHLRLRE